MDGKIVIGGSLYSTVTRNFKIGVFRYNSNGTLDTGFGLGGFSARGTQARTVGTSPWRRAGRQ